MTTHTSALTTDQSSNQLPSTVRSFTEAHAARDADAALALLTADAVISDVGESFTGEESLRDFVSTAGAEFSYTDEVVGVRRDGEVRVLTTSRATSPAGARTSTIGSSSTVTSSDASTSCSHEHDGPDGLR